MKTSIDITAEQLIKSALNRYKVVHEDPDTLVSGAIVALRYNTDPCTVVRQSVTNSVAEGIRKIERQAMAAESEFEAIGQMSLLGDLIPEHKIPAAMKSKSAAEVHAWMENRAKIERDNLDELWAAVEKQDRKTGRFSAWASATRQVCDTLEGAGIDPKAVTYAEAISKAEAIHTRCGADVGKTAGRPVR